VKKINLQAQIFKSKNITLKPINIECLEDFYKHSLNRKVFKFMNFNRFSKKKIKQYLQHLIKKSKRKNFQTWQIMFKSNFAGTITLRYSELKPYALEMAYVISVNFWRKGIFFISSNLILKYLKKKKEVDYVFCKVRVDNLPSLNALLKLKFKIFEIKKEKVIKNNHKFFYLLRKKF
jgi:RimJ/RimL family protein N-acetyltransferase